MAQWAGSVDATYEVKADLIVNDERQLARLLDRATGEQLDAMVERFETRSKEWPDELLEWLANAKSECVALALHDMDQALDAEARVDARELSWRIERALIGMVAQIDPTTGKIRLNAFAGRLGRRLKLEDARATEFEDDGDRITFTVRWRRVTARVEIPQPFRERQTW